MEINILNCLIAILFFAFLLYFIFKLFKKKRIKGIGQKRYLELMDIGDDLKKEIQDFISQRTKVVFSFISLGTGDYYDEIKCEWLKTNIKIKGNLFESYIDIQNLSNGTNYIKNLISQKVELIQKNQKKEFIIDIYLQQTNNYNIILDIHQNKSYSLDTIYCSNDKKLFPKNIVYEKNELFLDDFGLDNLRRNCLINIEKNSCINFIKTVSKLINVEKNEIFEFEENKLFLNVRIKTEDKYECSLFLDEKLEDFYELTKNEITLLDKFNSEIIKNFIKKYKDYNFKKITSYIEDQFLEALNDFALKNDPSNYNNYNIISQENETNNLDEEIISLKNDNLIIYEDISEKKNNESPKVNNDFKLNLEKKEKESSLLNLGYIVLNFFQCSLDRRYVNEPSKEDLEIVEKICFLSISLNSNNPLKSIIYFYNLKNEIINQIQDFSYKGKIKVLCCIKSHVMESIPQNLELQKMIDLPEFSPYLQGELMYRNIIKNITKKSKINFIFLQLISGGGYDFIKKDTCYKLKMIPLVVIKSHLLNKFDNYFFKYSNGNTDEYAFYDPISHLISINETKVFISEKYSHIEDTAYIQNDDNSIKVGIIQLHEKGRPKKYGKKENLPRYLTQSDLDLYDNYFEKKGGGESGFALDALLLGNNNYFSTLLQCRGLNNLSNYKLFIQEDDSDLLNEINKIFLKNNINIDNLETNKMINSRQRGFEGSKYVKLKTLEEDFINNIKKRINKTNILCISK